MIPAYITAEKLSSVIEEAISEDVGEGDHSTLSVIPAGKNGQAILIAKEYGIIAGIELVPFIYKYFDGKIEITNFKDDGDQVVPGDKIFSLNGNARSILSGERLILNFIQRMSGIATQTNKLVRRIAGHKAKILDTRKTTPNFRIFEKWAVLIGGGENHRIGLYDQILLKDNHIDFSGGIKNAILSVQKYLKQKKLDFPVEIETRNLKEVQEVIDTGLVDIIMFDNMTPDDMQTAVRMVNGKMKTEASGNIDYENIESVAACGVDFISVGALTHSVKSLDLSLKTII